MKHLYIICILFLSSCEEQADFYKDGIPYRIEKKCLDKHKEMRTNIYSRYNGGYYYSDDVEWVCTKEKIDTIEIKFFNL